MMLMTIIIVNDGLRYINKETQRYLIKLKSVLRNE